MRVSNLSLGDLGVVAGLVVLSASVKLLLTPSYRSTDFEVHRNWLAITHSLPVKDWYFEATSEWTLDYPPFFAFFEYALSQLAVMFDPDMVKISSQPYASPATIMFQRCSVIWTDLLLLWGAMSNIGFPSGSPSWRTGSAVVALVVLDAGLLMVDHMHFQYNGLLFGLLMLSVAQMRQDRLLLGGILFAVLLMFKHLFLSLAPVYFVYLLRHYCMMPHQETVTTRQGSGMGRKAARSKALVIPGIRWTRLLVLGGSVLGVFAAAVGPFVLRGGVAQLLQIARRLFPFGRGLVHAYWAPNVWAIFCAGDVGLGMILRKGGLIPPSTQPSFTSGLVQDITPEVLPKVTPPMTFVLVLASIAPALVSVWRSPSKRTFVFALFQSSLCAFMLGWHVHEKAVLVPLLLLALLALDDVDYARLYLRLAAVGHMSLLPLFPALSPDVLSGFLLATSHSTVAYTVLAYHHALPPTISTANTWGAASGPGQQQQQVGSSGRGRSLGLTWMDRLYCLGLYLVVIFSQIVHPVMWAERLPFLGRMVMSVYCSIGIAAVWVISFMILQSEQQTKQKDA